MPRAFTFRTSAVKSWSASTKSSQERTVNQEIIAKDFILLF